MKYMLLIYTDENAWTESEREHCYAESTRLTHELHARGQYLGAAPLRPVATAAFFAAASGIVVFAAGYQATLRQGAAEQATFAVPLSATVAPGPTST